MCRSVARDELAVPIRNARPRPVNVAAVRLARRVLQSVISFYSMLSLVLEPLGCPAGSSPYGSHRGKSEANLPRLSTFRHNCHCHTIG